MPSVLKDDGDVAAVRDGDDAAVAFAECSVHDGFGRLLDGLAGELHAGGNRVGDGVADELFAGAGARDGARAVVGVGAGADDRGVADAAPALGGEAARGRRGGEVAVAVEGDGADRAVLAV